MKDLRIYFSDFWGSDFDIEENYFTRVLRKEFNVILDPGNPEIVIYSVYGPKFLKFKSAKKVCFIAENLRPNFCEADYSISFDYDTYNARNIRLPLYVIYGQNPAVINKPPAEQIAKSKTKFCNMIVSNPNAKERIEFFKILNAFKKVDSGGSVLNNLGYRVKDKTQFISNYRFTMAFENSGYYGYTTEKIYQPMKAQSIPIYWGSESAVKEFNPKSFVNVHDYANLREAAEAVMAVEEDYNLYLQMLSEPWFTNNKYNEYFDEKRINDFFQMILDTPPLGRIQKEVSNLKASSSVTLKRIKSKVLGIPYCHLR